MARDDRKPDEPEAALTIAREELEKANNDTEAAVAAIKARVMADKALVASRLDQWVEGWTRELVSEVMRKRRAAIERAAASPNFAQALNHGVNADYQRFMDMPLYGGKRLGSATAAEVRESATHYEALSKSSARRAKWQNAVADAADKNGDPQSPISNTLSEATLARLWEEISNGD